MTLPVASLIIPFFNEEHALPRCLESVINQTLGDVEIILVDDGSTDASAAICRRFVDADARIILIRQDRAGVAAARNAGLERATGEYVQFVDADDWLEPGMTAALVGLARAHGADMAACGFRQVFPDRTGAPAETGKFYGEGVFGRGAYIALHRYTLNFRAFAALWNKLYLRTTIEKYRVRFRPGMAMAEDFLFNIHFSAHCRTVVIDNAPLYTQVIESAPDRLPMAERFEPDSIATMLELCRGLLQAGAGDLAEETLPPLQGALASQLLVAVVRACRRDSPLPMRETLAQLRRLRQQPDAMAWFRHYRPEPGQSLLMPALLQNGLVRSLFYLARHKADRRYPCAPR